MFTASVSNIEQFRQWREDEELDVQWIQQRILESQQTEAMRVGEAFHKALECCVLGDMKEIAANGYSFGFLCDCDLELAPAKELRLAKDYGELTVRGRVDATWGKRVADYKTSESFFADPLMNGYQWRFYLDMAEADVFIWNVFTLRETDTPKEYVVTHMHQLEQRRYPGLQSDCERLAADYLEFALKHVFPLKELVKA